jgi:PAS domain S-box-containing protein
MQKKPYVSPRLIIYFSDQVPERIKCIFDDDSVSAAAITTVVDADRRYVQVSNAFCELICYKTEELIGKRYDEITAAPTSDIPAIFDLFKKRGHMQGIWTLVHRTGQQILIRYEAWIRPDSFIESSIEVVNQLR